MDELTKSNSTLNKYFSQVVCMSVADTRHIEDTVMSNIFDIVKCVNGMDWRFSAEPVGVGSAYQKLKVHMADEFDLNIPLVGIDPSDVTLSTKPLHFGFKGGFDDSVATVEPNLSIVGKRKPMKTPGVEYFAVRLDRDLYDDYEDFLYRGFLIPYKVKVHLKKLINIAIRKLRLKGVSLDDQVHGPALTLNVKHRDYEPAMVRVNIDVAVVLDAVVPFDTKSETADWEFQAIEAGWPSLDKVDEILDMGINAVAKKNFHWALSYAECEKALVEKMDADGGIRKKVHRIMKSLWREATNEGQDSKLNTYMLKNVWLLECERLSDEDYWTPESLSSRYYCCMKKLREYLKDGELPLYFCRSVNLLRGMSDEDFDEMLNAVDDMKQNLKEFKAEHTA